METAQGFIKVNSNSDEKERLELVEKKVGIQRKRLEIKKEKLRLNMMIIEKDKEQLELTEKRVAIQNSRLDNLRIRLELQDFDLNRQIEAERMLNNKIFALMFTLAVSSIDDERTILGSEPFYVPILRGDRREIALSKLTELITKL